MSSGWYLFLFLFILGVTAQGFNQFGIWQVKYPESQFSVTNDMITSTETGVQSSNISIFVIYQWVVTFLTIIGSGVLAVISLGLLFYGMGWPIGIIGAAVLQLIQLPANLIIFVWLFELWTQRSIG